MAPSWFKGGASPLLRLQKELLKVGGSWRSASFFLALLAIILKKYNISVYLRFFLGGSWDGKPH